MPAPASWRWWHRARRQVAAVLDRYTPEQRALLFDYFAGAAPAFREATEEIRADRMRRS
jgi:hypothetical protein